MKKMGISKAEKQAAKAQFESGKLHRTVVSKLLDTFPAMAIIFSICILSHSIWIHGLEL